MGLCAIGNGGDVVVRIQPRAALTNNEASVHAYNTNFLTVGSYSGHYAR